MTGRTPKRLPSGRCFTISIAKHKGVRNVVEIIEKYRDREIDRGLGR